MSTEWKSQQTDGKYSLQFETDNKETYKLMEKSAQMIIDGKFTVVTEIRHGKWENMTDVDSAYLNTYRCSVCGTTFWIDEIPEDANYNHCPNCGAKMDR